MKVFDLRFPLGCLFVTLGVLLVIAGMLAAPGANARSLGININRVWGAVIVAFGILCVALAWREARRRRMR
jgi:protein-S-isoprenylcysteine O-methyltransferase Ste14